MILTNNDTHSFRAIYQINKPNKVSRILIALLITFIICLFLPWTQNIRSKGKVTTLKQERLPVLNLKHRLGSNTKFYCVAKLATQRQA